MAHSSDNTSFANPLVPAIGTAVTDISGHHAVIESVQESGAEQRACLRFADGPQLLVPVSLLAAQADGSYRVPFSLTAIAAQPGAMQMTIPVVKEVLQVDKRVVDTGRGVRIHKTVSAHEEVLNPSLRRDEIVIEHVPVGQVVDDAYLPQARYEGDTLVIPVLEEVLVVQKQLLLKEEVRIKRQQQVTQAPQTVWLRSEQVAVERFDEQTNRQA